MLEEDVVTKQQPTAEPIQIKEDMPEDLKEALSYLNETGVGLNPIDVPSDEELNDDGPTPMFSVDIEVDEDTDDRLAEINAKANSLSQAEEEELDELF